MNPCKNRNFRVPNMLKLLIIDPIASSNYLYSGFTSHNVQIIVLRTAKFDIDYLNFQNVPFLEIIDSDSNVEKDLRYILSKYGHQILTGFYGVESSVVYADNIFNHLFPKSCNQIVTSQLRTNKFDMLSQLNNLQQEQTNLIKISAKQPIEMLVKQVENFYENNQGHIIIKPETGSAGSEGVFFPQQKSDIEDYFQQLRVNVLAESDFLLQEKLEGQQFYVNTASYQGRHILAGAGKYEKKYLNNKIVSLYDDCINIYEPQYKELATYTIFVLNSLGMKNGLSHVEIIQTSKGYQLIELNPRIAGALGYLCKMAKKLLGFDQIDAYCHLIEGKELSTTSINPIHQRLVMLRNLEPDQITYLNSLTSYHEASFFKKPQFGLMGLLWLCAENKSQLEKDYEKIEKEGMILP